MSAMHWLHGAFTAPYETMRTACGLEVPRERTTNDRAAVTCGRCRRIVLDDYGWTLAESADHDNRPRDQRLQP